jgi:glycosyltransferase involved in cell wall biosynthesis
MIRSLTTAIDAVDIVHTHLFAGHFWGRLAARRSGRARVISTVHNIDRDERWYHRQLRRRTASWADHTVCVSEAVRVHCLQNRWAAEDRVSVIENGVDLERFVSPRAVVAQAKRVLAVGRLVPQKGFDILIQACEGLDLTLEIVGEGPERRRLEAMAPANVRLVGAQEDIPARLADADLFVVPSRWEGFGLVAAEAMAAGVPVVATGVDGLREVVGDTCANVPPEDVEALRAAISTILGDEHERTRRVNEGLARVRARFDLHRTVQDYAQRYQSVLGNDRA